MKIRGKLKFLLIFSFFVCIACFQFMCSAEKIGLQDPSPVAISAIMEQIESARTQAEADFAIRQLLEKTGLGVPVRGSRYTENVVDDGVIADLVQDVLLNQNDEEFGFTWAEALEFEADMPDDDWTAEVAFPEIAQRLQDQATLALADPESPNNALIMAILAKGADIPAAVPAISEHDRLTAVQDFLLAAWVNAEFQNRQALHGRKRGFLKIKVLTVNCPSKKKIKTKIFVPYFSKNQKRCLKAIKKIYKRCAKKCFRKKRKKTCAEIDACLDAANAELERFIAFCDTVPHDQGSGD